MIQIFLLIGHSNSMIFNFRHLQFPIDKTHKHFKKQKDRNVNCKQTSDMLPIILMIFIIHLINVAYSNCSF